MVLTDRIMAGLYPDFFSAIGTIYRTEGLRGFYLGWMPALVQKIPSYALTWMFFQQCKAAFVRLMSRAGTSLENLLLGSLAAAGACCIMIPIDTIKTRLVTQGTEKVYSGMTDCLQKVPFELFLVIYFFSLDLLSQLIHISSQMMREEGIWSLYRALTPRLLSVVPMIGIQFMVYELIKRLMLHQPPPVARKVRAGRAKKEW